MKFVVGLTGQTGAGKSSLCTTATEFGFCVIDCDSVAHTVQQRAEVKEVLCKAFGNGILLCDGTLDRKALAKAAFSSKAQTELLNKTILPFILSEIANIIANTKEEYILLDAPTLFESGANKLCDKTIGVIAECENRYNRIVKRDNLTDKQAKRRIAAGKPDSFYNEKCDYVLTNNGTEVEFINNFKILIKDILGGKV